MQSCYFDEGGITKKLYKDFNFDMKKDSPRFQPWVHNVFPFYAFPRLKPWVMLKKIGCRYDGNFSLFYRPLK